MSVAVLHMIEGAGLSCTALAPPIPEWRGTRYDVPRPGQSL